MLIRNLRLIDGAGDIRDGVDVRIHDGRFAEIGPGLDADGEELDAGGATAIPGLIDAHTPLTLDATPDALDNAIDLPLAEQAGGARAARGGAARARRHDGAARAVGVAALSLELRDSNASGSAPGPRIFTAGAWMTGPDGHGWHVGLHAEGPDGVRQAARAQLDDGADLLKLMVSGGVIGTGHGPGAEQYNEEEVAIVTSLAHAEGKRVAAHAHGEPSIRNAVRGGVDTVEHASFVTAELIEEMLERGTFIVPTLAVIHFVIESASEALGEETLQRAREVAEVHHANISAAWRRGRPDRGGHRHGQPVHRSRRHPRGDRAAHRHRHVEPRGDPGGDATGRARHRRRGRPRHGAAGPARRPARPRR